MKKYTVRTACEVAGKWKETGAEVWMTDESAKYLAPPLGRVLNPADVEPVKPEIALQPKALEADQVSALQKGRRHGRLDRN
ncbi:hypothetical protein FJ872_19415 [Mesorhizobium sp. B2-5-9]|uniref:hypothetical protein n=1 Tax=Mesorhizobium sp. B2-5-9 TaxID=2589921 RepID=UPI001126EA69|nr:hypothetical protein [Mesorhizobium sp. B2-5-9]TPK15169.1 hypothetical protein FJ872_19415 [Mesorhizobium sp. B2-5-9]